MKNENWCSNYKSTTSKRESCHYKQRGVRKKVADVEESSFTFKIDNDNPRKVTIPTGATSHVISDAKKFKNYDQTFQPENYNMELADGTKLVV